LSRATSEKLALLSAAKTRLFKLSQGINSLQERRFRRVARLAEEMLRRDERLAPGDDHAQLLLDALEVPHEREVRRNMEDHFRIHA